MKKTLFILMVMFSVFVGFTGQSWAMGGGHHHDGGSSQGNNQGNNQGGDNNQNFGNNTPKPNVVTPPTNSNFPAAPVPEPMTMSLLGMGLGGVLLKRKLR